MMKFKSKANPWSLTVRVLVSVAIAISFSLILSSMLILQSINNHFEEQDLGELITIVNSVEKNIKKINKPELLDSESLSRSVAGHHGVYFQIESGSGELIFRSHNADFFAGAKHLEPVTNIEKNHIRVWESSEKKLRGVVAALTWNTMTYRVTAAIDLDFHLYFLDKFRKSLMLIMLATGLITLLAAWLGIHQGLLPLRSLRDGMHKIQTNHLDERLDPEKMPVELRELVFSFNQMTERLENGFQRLSHFSADIAHELRTPLTNLITQNQVGLSKSRSANEYRELLYSGLEEQERLSKMVSDMLWLAKSDNELIKPALVAVNLSVEISELIEFFEPLAAEKKLAVTLHGEAPPVRADRDLLRHALSNLIANAIRYANQEGEIDVELSTEKKEFASISISNTGEAISEEHLTKIFDRFYRVDPSRYRQGEGAGLGLAITKAIIKSHNGHISVQSGAGITIFRILLPV